MKTYQIRELADDELKSALKDNYEALENFRFQKAAGQLENFNAIKNTKKDISKMLTILKERELGINKKLNSKSK